jgi:hypothetical protein
MHLALRRALTMTTIVSTAVSVGCFKQFDMRSRELSAQEKLALKGKSKPEKYELPMVDDLDQVTLAAKPKTPEGNKPTDFAQVTQSASQKPALPSPSSTAGLIPGGVANNADNPADRAIAELMQLGQDQKNPLADKLPEIGKTLAAAAGPFEKSIDFEVLYNDRPRTCHSSTGRIFVNTGVFKVAKSEREVAGLLALEIAELISEQERDGKTPSATTTKPDAAKSSASVGNAIAFKSVDDRAAEILSKTPYAGVSIADCRDLVRSKSTPVSKPGIDNDRARMNRQIFEGMRAQ